MASLSTFSVRLFLLSLGALLVLRSGLSLAFDFSELRIDEAEVVGQLAEHDYVG